MANTQGPSKEARERAYKAGWALPDVNWAPVADTIPPEKRVPGPHHCPFTPDQPLYDDWMKGLEERLAETAAYDPAEVAKQVAEARKEAGA